jgi:sugar phosphate isomerase/epimerase
VSRRLPVPLLAAALVAVQVVAAAGCTSGARAPAAAANDDAPGFAFSGDFRGPLGVQLYSFRDAFRGGDVPGTLARVRALGFREVELAGTYGMSAQQLRRELDRAGLRATSMHAGYERLRDSLPAVLAEAKVLGAGWVGTAWIPHPAGPITEEIARRAAADFDRAGRAARAQGIGFFYHIHGYEFRAGPNGVVPMDVLVRETDPDAVKFELDTFWAAHPGADPAALLRRWPGRWKLMHLKDMKRGVATGVHTGTANPDSTEVPVGSGQIDFRALLRAARDVGVERYYIEDETAAPFETVPRSVRWLEAARY